MSRRPGMGPGVINAGTVGPVCFAERLADGSRHLLAGAKAEAGRVDNKADDSFVTETAGDPDLHAAALRLLR